MILVFYGVMMWVNAWLADRSFRKGRIVWGALCAATAAFCFMQWAAGVWK